MKWYRVQAVILRHLYESRRNLDRIADMIYWPVMDIVMWGLFTIYLSRDTGARPGLVTFLMGDHPVEPVSLLSTRHGYRLSF